MPVQNRQAMTLGPPVMHRIGILMKLKCYSLLGIGLSRLERAARLWCSIAYKKSVLVP